MKKTLLSLCLTLSFPAFASIDDVPAVQVVPRPERVLAARVCFSELEKMGCGHPKDDHDHFKSCLDEAYERLDGSCQKIMKRLYRP